MSYAQHHGAWYGRYPWTPRTMLEYEASGYGTSLLAVLGGSRSFKGYQVGASVKYAEDRDQFASKGFLFDVGVTRDLNFASLSPPLRPTPIRVGLTIQNLGHINHMELPTRATLGASYARPVGPVDLSVVTAISARRDDFIAPSVAVEV